MARQTGSNFTLSIAQDGGTLVPVGHASSCTYSSTVAMEEATTKASGGVQEVIPGRGSATIAVSGFQDYETITGSPTPANIPTIEALHRTKALVDWSFAEAGGDVYSGEGYISDLELTAEADVTAGYSFTITRTGGTTFTAGS